MKLYSPNDLPVAGKTADIGVDLRQDVVHRVVESTRFQRSPKLKNFLQFVCERSAGQESSFVHEQQIGHFVYGRRPDYDTGADNIVRVEARRLRRELDAYFADEGRDEAIVITIPKGGYAPLFERRGQPEEELVPQPPLPSQPPQSPERKWAGLAGWIACGVTVLLAVLLLLNWDRLRTRQPTEPPAARVGVWPLMLRPGTRTHVVVADGALAAVQDISGVAASLDDYVSQRYAAGLLQPGLEVIARRQLTGMASLLFVSRIVHLNGGRLDNISVRHPRAVSVRDFQKDNHVLLGSRYSNPWVGLFRDKRNFNLEFVGTPPSACYQNRSPRAGEPKAYCGSGSAGEQYGVVAFLPNLAHTGDVLMIEGTTAEGTEAAWEFLSSGDQFTEFIHRQHLIDKGNRMPYFELVLRASTRGGAPVESVYVTHRRLDETQR